MPLASKLKDDALLAQGILGLNSLPDSTFVSKCKDDSILLDSVTSERTYEQGKRATRNQNDFVG